MALNAAQRLEWHPPAAARAEAGAGAGLTDAGVVRAASFFSFPPFSPRGAGGAAAGEVLNFLALLVQKYKY